MSRLLSLSVRVQMFLMALLVILPAAAIIIFTGIKLRQADIAAAIQETRKISDGMASEQQQAAASAEQLMTALAQLPEIRNHDDAKTHKILADILKICPLYLNLSVVDPDGMVWASAVTNRQVDLKDRRYFKNAMATGRLASGEFIISRMALQPTVNLCYPFKDSSGAIKGLLTVAFHLDRLGPALSEPRPGDYRYTLLDHKGIVLGSSKPDKNAGEPDLPEMIGKMQGPALEGSFIGRDVDGQRRYITYRKLRLKTETAPYLYIRVGVPIASVAAQANALLHRNLLIFAISLLCAFLAAWLIGKHSILDRVAVLQGAARRLAGGDLKVRVAESISGGDLGELARAFDDMAQRLEVRERERAEAEQALRRSESRYRSLFDNSLFGIVALGRDKRFERVNQAFCRLLGYSEEELVGLRDFCSITHPDDLDFSREKHQAMMRGEVPRYTVEKRYLAKGGQVVQVVCFVEGSYSESGSFEGNFACILDITELKESQERMRLFFERQIVGMAITAPDMTWLQTNARLQQLLGYSAEELSRMSWEELTHPDDLPKSLEQFDRMLRGEIDEYVLEQRYLARGGHLLYFVTSIGCVRRHDGQVDYVLALYDDVTERTKAELEVHLLQSSLEQRVLERTAQLEAAVNEQESFSYSVSHDLRGPLRHINSYLAILKEEHGDALPEEAHHYLDRTRAASLKMGRLIDGLLELSRVSRSRLVKEPVDLSELARGVLNMLQEGEPERRVAIEVTPGLRGLGDKILMGQVLENLLGNAWKYTMRREEARLVFGAKGAGRKRVFFVRDNGSGFDMAYSDKLFGAFQRLHGEEYEGTGIGLATVKRIIDRHGGSVWAQAEPDAGATFYFTLP